MRYTPYTRLLKRAARRRRGGRDRERRAPRAGRLLAPGALVRARQLAPRGRDRPDAARQVLPRPRLARRTWSGGRAARCPRSAASRTSGAEHRPAGAADRCLECAIEPDCPYSARRIYLGMAERGETGWPVDVVAWPPTPENVGPRCATARTGVASGRATTTSSTTRWSSFAYEGGVDREPHDDGVHAHARPRDAHLRHRAASCTGTATSVEVYDFLTPRPTTTATTRRRRPHRPRRRRRRRDGATSSPRSAAGDPALVPTSPGRDARVAPDRVRGRGVAPRAAAWSTSNTLGDRVIHPGKEAAHGLTGPEDVRLARRLRRTNRREHRLGRCGTLRRRRQLDGRDLEQRRRAPHGRHHLCGVGRLLARRPRAVRQGDERDPQGRVLGLARLRGLGRDDDRHRRPGRQPSRGSSRSAPTDTCSPTAGHGSPARWSRPA